MTEYPRIFDPYFRPSSTSEELCEVMLFCECGFTVTDLQSKIERARKIMDEHKRTRHPAAKDGAPG